MRPQFLPSIIHLTTGPQCLRKQVPHSVRSSVSFFFLIKPKNALISKIYFFKKLCMFRAVPLPIIRSFLLYIRLRYMSCRYDDSFQKRPGPARKLSSNVHDIYQCRMYSAKLLIMGRGTARNM